MNLAPIVAHLVVIRESSDQSEINIQYGPITDSSSSASDSEYQAFNSFKKPRSNKRNIKQVCSCKLKKQRKQPKRRYRPAPMSDTILSLHVSARLKSKIWPDDFIELGTLLPDDTPWPANSKVMVATCF